jgi:hypothetical protein
MHNNIVVHPTMFGAFLRSTFNSPQHAFSYRTLCDCRVSALLSAYYRCVSASPFLPFLFRTFLYCLRLSSPTPPPCSKMSAKSLSPTSFFGQSCLLPMPFPLWCLSTPDTPNVPEPVFVVLFRSPGIDSQPGGPLR